VRRVIYLYIRRQVKLLAIIITNILQWDIFEIGHINWYIVTHRGGGGMNIPDSLQTPGAVHTI
jgi:hypothetical protein